MANTVFPENFLYALQTLVNMHHSLYHQLPPQWIFFEALVQVAFRRVKKPFTVIQAGGANQPRHDLLVEDARISLKTQTGLGTSEQRICITKLCTTEKEPWEAGVLVPRVSQHLDRYDFILMLRAIWKPPLIHYQLVEIPVNLLRRMASARFEPVGRRIGRRSIGGDIVQEGEVLFHVHFDGSDGKCQIRT